MDPYNRQRTPSPMGGYRDTYYTGNMEDLKNGRKCWIEKLTFNQFWKGL